MTIPAPRTTTMTNLKIITPAGRTLSLSADAVSSLEETGMVGAGYTSDAIDGDIDQVVAGALSLAGLLSACRAGVDADDRDRLGAWSDYAHEVARVAEREMTA